jgi:type IV pilus assembly protein PilW
MRAFRTTVPTLSSCRGLTLVEMMIALTLGLILMGVIGYAYVGGRQASRTTDALSRMQENARYVFEKMANDIRMVGFSGCLHVPSGSPPNAAPAINALASPVDWYKNLFGQPITGSQDATPAGVCTTANTEPCYQRGDTLAVLRADNTRESVVAAHAAPQFTTVSPHNFKAGEILVVADCAHAAVFQAATDTVGATIKYAGNLGTTFPANSSRVMPLSAVTYYIGSLASGEPALFRNRIGTSGSPGAPAPEVLVEGVEDIQIQYGVNTNAAEGVDTFVTADAVSNWANIHSVRISLLMVSRAGENITTGPQTYSYNGATVTPTDRLFRKAFTTTIAVRNRL